MSTHSLEYQRAYRKKNREKLNARSLAWQKRHQEEHAAYMRDWNRRPDVRARRKTAVARAKAAAHQRAWRSAHREHVNLRAKENREKLRLLVLEAYGGKCRCCGETKPQFLSIDHINGDGKEDRAKYNQASNTWLSFLLKNKPDHVQILCYNCNMAKAHYGICPHQKRRT